MEAERLRLTVLLALLSACDPDPDPTGVGAGPLDAPVLLDAPGDDSPVQVEPMGSGVKITWPALAEGVMGYDVYRRVESESEWIKVNTDLVTTLSFRNEGLSSTTLYRFGVSPVMASGEAGTMIIAGRAVAAADPLAEIPRRRASQCPVADVTVTSADQLRAALSSVQAGQVILIKGGENGATRTYTGPFKLAGKAATAAAPIWICGERSAVLTMGNTSSAQSLALEDVSHVIVAGFTMTGSLHGIMVRSSDHVSVSDLHVKDIGQEGIHLLRFTTDSVVNDNLIERMGLTMPKYGEGVYIGTSNENWYRETDGNPDRSDRNVVMYNEIRDTGAEGIEGKMGTTGGIVHGNVIDGFAADSEAWGWVLVTGDGWLVRDNSGVDVSSRGYGVRSMQWVGPDGYAWGKNNVYANNSGDLGTYGTYGIQIHAFGSTFPEGLILTCNNDFSHAPSGRSNYRNCQH